MSVNDNSFKAETLGNLLEKKEKLQLEHLKN